MRGMSGLGADAGGAGQAEALAAASADVTLEDLPAYEETSSARVPDVNTQEPMIAPQARRAQPQARPLQAEPLIELGNRAPSTAAPINVPADAPPGYEEAQNTGVMPGLGRD